VIVRMKTPISGSREVRKSRTGKRLPRLRHWAGHPVEAEDRKRDEEGCEICMDRRMSDSV